jgi:hypothetical protein
MRIEICTHNWRFHRRQWWQLSSIAQQIDPPEIINTLNFWKEEEPEYEQIRYEMIRTFDNKVTMNTRYWTDPGFQYRYNVRTHDLQNTTADWLLWTDPDILFHPHFFRKLARKLETYKHEGKVLSVRRISVENGNELIDSQDYREGRVVENAVEKTGLYHAENGGSTVGAGYFQLINVQSLRERGITEYPNSPGEASGDRSLWEWKSKHKPLYRTYSDKAFRKLVGRRKFNFKCPIYHLEHYRRGEKEFENYGCF